MQEEAEGWLGHLRHLLCVSNTASREAPRGNHGRHMYAERQQLVQRSQREWRRPVTHTLPRCGAEEAASPSHSCSAAGASSSPTPTPTRTLPNLPLAG